MKRINLLAILFGSAAMMQVNAADGMQVKQNTMEMNSNSEHNAPAGERLNQETDIQKQQEKMRKEIERRLKKIEDLKALTDRTHAEEEKLNAQIAELKTQPDSTENLKKQNILIKQINKQIKTRQKLERNINEEASKIESVSRKLSAYEEMMADNNNDAPAELPDFMNVPRKTLFPSAAAGYGKGLIAGGNLIAGNNNVVIIVDDRQKAEDIAAMLQSGNIVPSSRERFFYQPLEEKEYRHNNAGQINKQFAESLFNHFSIGFGVSTMGLGAEIATTVSHNLQLRLGYDYFNYDFDKAIDVKIQDPAVNMATGVFIDPELRSGVAFDYSNYHALIDFYPLHRGIFHFTAGIYYGKSEINIGGRIIDGYDGKPLQLREDGRWPDLYFAGYKIPVNNGYVNMDIKPDNRWKPYFGIGLGRTVSKSPVSFKLEFGALYQGKYRFLQNGVELPESDRYVGSFVKEKYYTRWLKFYPAVSLQINIRLW
jgi:hypothetical protein